VFHTPALFGELPSGHEDSHRFVQLMLLAAARRRNSSMPSAATVSPQGEHANRRAAKNGIAANWSSSRKFSAARTICASSATAAAINVGANYMRGVIEREPQYNALLVEGFNRGYRQEEARFPVCDSTTRQMEAELRARGVRIAQGLSARHTGPRMSGEDPDQEGPRACSSFSTLGKRRWRKARKLKSSLRSRSTPRLPIWSIVTAKTRWRISAQRCRSARGAVSLR
jgi:predicted secreted protein